MREDLELRICDHLDGTLEASAAEPLARELEADPQALGEFADQLQIDHRLRVALGKNPPPIAAAVVRELRLQGDSRRFSDQVVDRIKGGSRPTRRIWELAAAALLLAGLGFLLLKGGGPDPPSPAGRAPAEALLVVGRLPLEEGDARVKARLETLGCRVTTARASQVATSDAAGKSLVILSSTALAKDVLDVQGELTAKFRETPVPLLVWEPRLFYDLGMIPGAVYHADWGAAKDQTSLRIVDPSHPLAGGLSGTVTITTKPSPLSWGRARADAIKIAAIVDDPARAAVFAYEKDARMPGLVAPARRVGLFLFDATGRDLSPRGWTLFDAAVRWCLGG